MFELVCCPLMSVREGKGRGGEGCASSAPALHSLPACYYCIGELLVLAVLVTVLVPGSSRSPSPSSSSPLE
jgi:hypothetical protein